MAHFAKLNAENIVEAVFCVNNAELDSANEEQSGIDFLITWSGGHTNWKQTSYNGTFRKRFAGIGYKYDENIDAFIAPKPYDSWLLDENYAWQPPTPKPKGLYYWDEPTLTWVKA